MATIQIPKIVTTAYSRSSSPQPTSSRSRCPSPQPTRSRSRNPSPTPRSISRAASSRPHSRCQSPIPSISRDESDAIRRIVDEIIERFVDLRDKGYPDEIITKYIYDSIILNKRQPFHIYDWLLNNQNTVQYITLLGYFYLEAIGTEEDLKKSFHSFLTAAKMDYSMAQDLLADCYNFGYGTTKNEELCFMWYTKAFEGGSVNAEYNIGECYKSGFGISRDKRKTVRHYKNASKKGNVSAMYHLGWCYERGVSVRRNFEMAMNWYNKALKNGHILAQEEIDRCSHKMNFSDTSSNPLSTVDSQASKLNLSNCISDR
ncbi:11165_t:CDS:1 [Acaulospora colombiana]|uniref:11165_t:CDS:1 n=1 Tax=Acaulospora colombiana TaxID=27376 RepID=A0ACA9KXS0_9GLOM|nr:11165_t:CDS:1 [Acaulospora colombiana]